MATCDHCNSHVTDAFRRVFEVNGELVACNECGIKSDLTRTIHERHEELEALPSHGRDVS